MSSDKVLLVDDDQDVLDFLQTLLAVEGVGTVQATEAGAALQALQDQSVGLVLLDIAMPGVDGIQLCRQIKATPQTSRLPVVVLSARPGQQAEDEALAAGADDFLRKPFDNEALVSVIRSRLRSG